MYDKQRETIEAVLRLHAETTGDKEPLELFALIADAGATLATPPAAHSGAKHTEAWMVVTSLGR